MRTLFLYGPPASGKTTLGKFLAGRLRVPFADLDACVEERTGRSVAEIFAAEGEEGFRRRESEALHALPAGGIVALGGGTLLDAANRVFCEERGAVLRLSADDATLAQRIAATPGRRPLGDRAAERAEHYASFPLRLDAHFALDVPDASDIFVGAGLLALVPALVAAGERLPRVVVVADANTAPLYGVRVRDALAAAGCAASLCTIPAGEACKNLETVQTIWKAFLAAGLGRNDLAVAVGGGVTGDLAGFAAATWMRGIDWVNVPTTNLAMADASTGGKTGFDLVEGKNLVGAFHAPRYVVIDEAVLATLPETERLNGLAETLKHEIICGRKCPTLASSLAVKVDIVRADPYEKTGERAKLNCGHTVGHALEILTDFRLRHGEAVAIGCVEEARLAVRLGLADAAWAETVRAHFAAAGLPTELPEGLSFAGLVPAMKRDKKAEDGRVTFALPCADGDVRLVPVDPESIR